jgi:hypothetical protein
MLSGRRVASVAVDTGFSLIAEGRDEIMGEKFDQNVRDFRTDEERRSKIKLRVEEDNKGFAQDFVVSR